MFGITSPGLGEGATTEVKNLRFKYDFDGTHQLCLYDAVCGNKATVFGPRSTKVNNYAPAEHVHRFGSYVSYQCGKGRRSDDASGNPQQMYNFTCKATV